jgi:hypothetical protein
MSTGDRDQSGARAESKSGKQAGAQNQAAVDVNRLAEKVYQLMLAEARLARARQER